MKKCRQKHNNHFFSNMIIGAEFRLQYPGPKNGEKTSETVFFNKKT